MILQLSLTILSVLFTLTFSAELPETFRDVVIQSVDRQVDLQSQLTKIDTTVELKNERASNLEEFYFAVPSDQVETLRFFLVRAGSSSKTLEYNVVDNLKIKNEYGATLYRVHLENPIKPGQTQNLKIQEVHFGRLAALPKYIAVNDDQKMVLDDSVYFFSPYTVLSQTSYYRCPSMPQSVSNSDGNVRGQNVEFRYSTSVSPFQKNPNRIHYVTNTPFVIFTEVVKTIEVSHWGNINVQEAYKISNKGAEFRGEFSRVDYSQYNPNTGKSALKGLNANYPVHAWGMHYRDEVGNISTSRAYRDHANVKLQITPRFAVFGGWSHNWVISYNLPTKHYLFAKENESDRFVLKQSFGYPFENILAEKYTVRVVLPEGAVDARAELPFSLDSQSHDKTFGYLDLTGRPTLVLEKNNMLDFYNRELIIHYKFDSTRLLTEPFMLFVIFLALFLSLIILGRVSLTPERPENKQQRPKKE